MLEWFGLDDLSYFGGLSHLSALCNLGCLGNSGCLFLVLCDGLCLFEW